MRRPLKTAIAAILTLALALCEISRAQIQVQEGLAIPDRILIDALDPAHINGVVFVTGNHSAAEQNFFGLRILVYRPGDSVDFSPRLFEFGPHAPNGSFAQASWRPQFDEKSVVTLKWSRQGDNIVIGKVTAPPHLRVAIEVYRPWSEFGGSDAWSTFWAQPDRRTIFGEQVQNQKNLSALRRFFLRTDRTAIGAASYEDSSAMRKLLVDEGHAQQKDQPGKPGVYRHAALSFDLTQDQSVGFIAAVGDNVDLMERESQKILQRPIGESLDQAEKAYDSKRTSSGGALGDSIEQLSRLVNWNRFYNPEKQLEYFTNNRSPSRQSTSAAERGLRGMVLSWDTLLTAPMAATVEGESAKASVRALLEGQMPDGRVPLRRHVVQSRTEPSTLAGRSMPPIGALSVWRVYLATYDLGLLAWAYPKLLQWNDWWTANRGDGIAWRDGNADGLLEWGFDAELEHGTLGARMIQNPAKLKLALSESGLDDRPQWSNGEGSVQPSQSSGDEVKYNDRSHTLEFSSVALNSLYALDTEMLTLMARELGLPTEADRLQTRYERIKSLINNKLWSEEDGLYLNRRWDGSFSKRLSPENFYPLLAGVAEEDRAKLMLTKLRDPKKLWGEYGLASIGFDDPAFSAQSPGRGAVWAPMNYLIYLGLRRYGFHDEAAELARKNAKLARASLENSGKFYDYYSSQDGRAIHEPDEGFQASFRGLMLLPGIEELISSDPWGGLAIGSLSVKEEARVERIAFAGSSFDVISGSERTVLRRGGNIEIECEGAVRLRAYRGSEHGISFMIDTKERVRILIPPIEGRKVTVSVDDKVLGSTSPGAAASFRIPAGVHKVFIVK